MADSRLCSIEECGNPAVNIRGWCWKHYNRWRMHGDPLKTVKTPHGDAQRFYRDVVLKHTSDECLIWPFAKNVGGKSVFGKGNLPRQICEEIHGPPPTPLHEAAHECGNGKLSCVAPTHLSWKTRKENEADKVRHGTLLRGEKMKNAILTEEDVREIRALYGKVSGPQIAARFGVKRSTVNNVIYRHSWAWLPD